jgi:hypothetical protein
LTRLRGVTTRAGRLDDLRRLRRVTELRLAERGLPVLRLRRLARLHYLRRFRGPERTVLLWLGTTRGALRWLPATPRLVRWLRSTHLGIEPP